MSYDHKTNITTGTVKLVSVNMFGNSLHEYKGFVIFDYEKGKISVETPDPIHMHAHVPHHN